MPLSDACALSGACSNRHLFDFADHPDGQRFLVLGALAREAEQPAAVVINWTSALPR